MEPKSFNKFRHNNIIIYEIIYGFHIFTHDAMTMYVAKFQISSLVFHNLVSITCYSYVRIDFFVMNSPVPWIMSAVTYHDLSRQQAWLKEKPVGN